MKKTLILSLITISLSSCDPSSDMEANIQNSTSQDLVIEFISFDQNLNKTLEIPVNETRLFQRVFDVGSDFIEPSLSEFDSIVIKNNAELILKVYKPDNSGNNIYNVDEHWRSSKPSKRTFKYEYHIYNEELM